MRKLINSTYISLDGVIQNPQDWPSLGSFAEDGDRLQTELLLACDGVVMGRHTYEGFAPVWSSRSGDAASDRINSMPKYVASTTLKDPTWTNTTVFHDDAVNRIAALKKESGGDLIQYGFGSLTYSLLQAGLIDELRMWIHPFFVGQATTDDLLFRPTAPATFGIADVTQLSSGVVILRYTAQH
jgi:dihydrofolate reductase